MGISRSPEGASTFNWYLAAGLLDELWLHSSPVALGRGRAAVRRRPSTQSETSRRSGQRARHQCALRVKR
jgi:riboflavin biosynthesis pyrimidine reductase